MCDNSSSYNFEEIDFNELMLDLSNQDLTQLNLRYRGEGNDNLVLSIPNIEYVLRIHKSQENFDEKTENENLKISFLYQYIFINSVFTSAYSLLPIIVKLPEGDVQKLDELFYSQRPDQRKEKRIFYNIVEVYPDCAFLPMYEKYMLMKKNFDLKLAPGSDYLKKLLSNHYINYRSFIFNLLTNFSSVDALISKKSDTEISTICVEIKPKQGWTAVSDRNFGICTFCMKQFLKLNTHMIGMRSNYCPLDLFSGNPGRMKHALKELLKAPQNNLRIFKNGELVFGEEYMTNIETVLSDWFTDSNTERCIDNFYYLIMKILTTEFVNNDEEKIPFICELHKKRGKRNIYSNLNMEAIEKNLNTSDLRCHQESSCLPDNSILGRILTLQKIDEEGLESALDFYEIHRNEFNSEFGYMKNLISKIQVKEKIEIPKLNVVEAYLLSAAAKDLSIIIALKRLSKDETCSKFVVYDMSDAKYEVKISVVDVGPKPVSCLKKQWKRNIDIINSYIKYFYPNSSSNNLSGSSSSC